MHHITINYSHAAKEPGYSDPKNLSALDFLVD
jgi:hypothetical protein